MRVIKNREVIDDGWRLLESDAAPPATGDVIVSLEQWNRHHAELSSRQGRTGVMLRSSELPEDVAVLDQVPLIAIDFPKWADGRGYSHARTLRERLGYAGELRAVGDVLRDQLFYMARCGIDSFALKPGKDIHAAVTAFDDFSVTYQPAADDPRPLFRRVRR